MYYFNILKLTESSTQEAETEENQKFQPVLGYIVSPRSRSYTEKKGLLRLFGGTNDWCILENFSLYMKNLCILLLYGEQFWIYQCFNYLFTWSYSIIDLLFILGSRILQFLIYTWPFLPSILSILDTYTSFVHLCCSHKLPWTG
jgi:hypothetical protein